MKAILYEISITDSVGDFAHGWSRKIKEIYIPELKIFFNGEAIAFYHTHRYKNAKKIKTINITKDDARYLLRYMDSGSYLDKIRKRYLSDSKERECK